MWNPNLGSKFSPQRAANTGTPTLGTIYGEQRQESGGEGRKEKEGAGIQTAHFPLGSIRPSHYGGWAKQIGNGWSRLPRRVLLAFQALTELYNSFGGKAQKPRVSYWPVGEREFELAGPSLLLFHKTVLYSVKRLFSKYIFFFKEGREPENFDVNSSCRHFKIAMA